MPASAVSPATSRDRCRHSSSLRCRRSAGSITSRGFEPDDFDYIVIDEFHHAAASTYRRVIDHFRPKFLLGLTATPDRTDGGRSSGLCQDNLVFQAGIHEGIEGEHLCPFHYFGVPDDVDYSNIPWRNAQFDLTELTAAVATEARARNALEQFRKLGGRRCIAFCCSQRHADFMADFFVRAGVKAVAVHAGAEQRAPRDLPGAARAGDLEVIFAVDMFNEGVDVPAIDTVLMLRPTESTIIWLQQLGRGLRVSADKERLIVIDYIGNHRAFLMKLRGIAPDCRPRCRDAAAGSGKCSRPSSRRLACRRLRGHLRPCRNRDSWGAPSSHPD